MPFATQLRIVVRFTGLALLVSSAALSAQTPPSAGEKDPWPAPKSGPLRVFILAGQSNMQGHASLRTLEYLIYQEETAAQFQQWKNREGRFTERSDVWIYTTDGARHGKLTPGFGANEWKIGPELALGWELGAALEDQVLLIKTCWGGRSVRKDFRPPGMPMPSDEELQGELTRAQQRKPETTIDEVRAPYGQAYRDMITTVKDVLARLKELYPSFDPARGYEIAGFIWFQGWNDLVDREQREEKYASYTQRLAQLIRDVRAEFDLPHLPVVIGELGVGGKPAEFQAAQRAVAELEDLKAHVRFAETHRFWDAELERMADEELWKTPEWPRYYNRGADRGYHYLGSAKILCAIGREFALQWLAMRKT